MLCFLTWLLVNEPEFTYEPKHQILANFAAGILFFKIKFTFFLKKRAPLNPWCSGWDHPSPPCYLLHTITPTATGRSWEGPGLPACGKASTPLCPPCLQFSEPCHRDVARDQWETFYYAFICVYIHHKKPKSPAPSLIPCTLTLHLSFLLTPYPSPNFEPFSLLPSGTER